MKRDTILRARDRDYRGLKARLRRRQRPARFGPVTRMAVDPVPTISFAEAEERKLLDDISGESEELQIEFMREYADVLPAARRILRKRGLL